MTIKTLRRSCDFGCLQFYSWSIERYPVSHPEVSRIYTSGSRPNDLLSRVGVWHTNKPAVALLRVCLPWPL